MKENEIGRRAKAMFPTVLLTLLSIVQALALELMWSHVKDEAYLYEWTFLAALGWMQIVTTLLGILLIWLIYSGLVMRFSWVPNTIDAVFPFLVGIAEFAQISALGPHNIGPWFVFMSIVFAAMSWISQVTMVRARQDDDNVAFFGNVAPATMRDHLQSIIPVILFLCVGIALWVTGHTGWYAMGAVVVLLLLLMWQVRMNHHFTMRSYYLPTSDGEDERGRG